MGFIGPKPLALLHSVFKFFSSVKLAVPILSLLMIILAAGTIIESLYGADAAKILVYDTLWFSVVLLILGVNVLAAALDRLPWQKKHTGFVITHTGILVILAGSFITRAFMIDGQMPVAEGQTESYITLSQPLVYVYSEDPMADWIYAVPKKAFPWEGRQKLIPSEKAEHEVFMLHYYPKARVREFLIPAEPSSEGGGKAAVRVRMKNSFLEQEHWLRENDERFGSLSLGPAALSFASDFLKDSPAAEKQDAYLEFQSEGRSLTVPVPPAGEIPKTVPLEGTPYQVTISRVLKNAVVSGNKLIDQESASAGPGKNPAVELVLEGEGLKEFHTVFARFPEFPTQHGMKPSGTGMRLLFRAPDAGSQSESHELRFVEKQGVLFYQIKTGDAVKTGKAETGKETATGWMDLSFTVEEYYPHSQLDRTFVPQPNISQAEDLVSAVEIEVRKGNESKRAWLAQGMRNQAEAGGTVYQLVYGQRRIPLGFKVELKDFKIEHYPGTDRPAQFSSDVVLKDDTRGIVRDHHISMNEPLEHQGFKIYQAAYSLEPGQPEISIFSVGRDPGVPVKYAGAIILITGTVIIFSQRKFKKRKQGGESLPGVSS